MLKKISFLFLVVIVFVSCETKIQTDNIVTTDIDNFWTAYDKIQTTKDSVQQMKYLKELFLDKGTTGLKAIMQVRRYKPSEYLEAINNYPKFWKSIRENTNSVHEYAEDIQGGIDNFKKIYPDFKPAKVFFEIGVFRTGGTALDSLVLIGSEIAMTDETVHTDELPQKLNNVKNLAKLNPVKDLAFLNVHEYVHTQQNVSWAYDLLSQSVFEGSAEFIAEIATEKPSINTAIGYGIENDEKVKSKFEKEMFVQSVYNWIWNNTNNEFNTRDLGYYIGYAIVKKHYNKATDKEKAIKEIIELDYTKPEVIEAFVESTAYFSKPLQYYKNEYEKNRPTVIGIEGLKNGSQNVSTSTTQFKVLFSNEMDQRFKSTGYGSLGADHCPQTISADFSQDGKSILYTIKKLKPNTEYEMVINFGYRTKRFFPLKPYTIKFKTAK
ncbi:hypothetical protein [uncultured Kordia sp.]|uniref:hypothetical protein n=1 Tax=uncultured Kordia sp. TaxID=507699 RepID=UPI002629315D|nr:hypothetical protein [uncultured Kordia sp.]